MGKPYVIMVASKKGGVGKTTVSVNLATHLAMSGYRTLLVDADESNPSVGFHLGLEDTNLGYSDVILKRTRLQNAITVHAPSGLHVLPGRMSKPGAKAQAHPLEILKQANERDYEFLILDTAPGERITEDGKDAKNYIDYGIIVITPEMPSCAGGVRMSVEFSRIGLKHGTVLNRIRNKRYEVGPRELERMLGNKLNAALPEDDAIPISIEDHIPLVMTHKRNRFSREIRDLGETQAYAVGLVERRDSFKNEKPSVFMRLLDFLMNRK